MQTKQPKREKRLYLKKRLLTQDELWKIIIPLLWDDFICYFLPEWVEQIDFSRKPEFLDKDLNRLMPVGKSKNRRADILMRVYLKNGEHKTFLLHVEVQAYFESGFPRRLFQYYYRISDLLQEPIETLVIMIDEDPNYRPNEYIEQCGQTKVHFTFRLFKLLDNPPPYMEGNIFSIVLEVAWYALKQNMLKNDEDLEQLKFQLMKRLVENKIEDEKIYAIFDFINIYLPFENPENSINFTKNIDNLINKDIIMEPMTIREYLAKKVLAQERRRYDRELKKQRVEVVNELKKEVEIQLKKEVEFQLKKEVEIQLKKEHEATILNLHAKGFAAETIADVLSKPLPFVLEVLEKNIDNQ